MKSLLVAAVMGLMCAVGASSTNAAGSRFVAEFGKSLPPVGFVKFCAANPGECKQVGRRAQRVSMSPDAWALVNAVNQQVNTSIRPVSDEELYGQAEYWTYPVDAGDCEDYLLLKKRDLEKLGFDAGALLITVVLDEKNEGHAVLTIATDRGDYVLDNRRNDILLWSATGYTFLKRQSQQDPRAWMALTNTPTTVLSATAGSN